MSHCGGTHIWLPGTVADPQKSCTLLSQFAAFIAAQVGKAVSTWRAEAARHGISAQRRQLLREITGLAEVAVFGTLSETYRFARDRTIDFSDTTPSARSRSRSSGT